MSELNAYKYLLDKDSAERVTDSDELINDDDAYLYDDSLDKYEIDNDND